MANRILLGKNTNSNHGFSTSSPGFGLYISRSSNHNVLTCTQDQLSFNTSNTNTGSATTFVDVGLFQIMPAATNSDGTVATATTVNITAGQTITINWSALYSILAGLNLFFGLGAIGAGGTNTASGGLTTTTTSTTSASVANSTGATISSRRVLWNPISSAAFF